MSKCSLCEDKAIYNSENGYLCKNHFLKYFKNKFYKTVRNNQLVNQDDVIAVGFSGGKDSSTMLYLLNKYCSKRNIKIFAILIDEGIQGYREHLIEYAKSFCDENGIELHIYSYEHEFQKTLDQIIKENPNEKPCSVCGIFRRYLLNQKVRELGATKLAIGHNLDDEAQTLLLNILQNKPMLIARSGIDSGLVKDTKLIKRIKPLYFLKEKEIMLYSILNKFQTDFSECPYSKESFRHDIRKKLNELNDKYPHTKSNIINSNTVLVDALRKHYDSSNLKISFCKFCAEPSSKDVCNACKMITKFNK